MIAHSITAEEYARIVAKVYEPDLDWDTPTEYDLTDREELTATAEKVLARLAWSGFVVQRLDDLALDEFDPSPSLEAVKAETMGGMHSDSCYPFGHEHGEACEYDCPTCHAQPVATEGASWTP